MKKILSLLSLAALTIGLLGSCSKMNERIDGLDNRVGNIENEKIASIENQIAAINSSIADLGTIRKDILDLQVAVGAKGEDIAELKAADEALGKRIDELQTYVDTELAKYATTEWANATFATLEQLKTTNTELGALKETVGKLGETFDGKLADLKTELTNAINTAVSNLETRISALEVRVSALEQMIQSVAIVPAYSDGSVEAVDGILTLKCIVSPAEALIGMESLKDSLLIYADSVKVKTKGASAYMEIEVSEASVLDAAQGAITLTADISEYLPKGEDKALTVAVNIKNGISDITTKFVPVSVAGPDIPEGALPGVFSVSADKKVHFSQGNLTYNVTDTKWAFYEHQYDCAIGYDSNLISLFTWGYDAVKSIAPNGGNYVEGHSNGETFSKTEDWGYVFGGESSVWRTLTKDEWVYLFNARTMTNSKARYSNAMSGVTIGSTTYKGVFLYPDDYNGEVVSSSMTWDAINAAGIVFLPAAGCRYYSDVLDVGGHGYYWSSTAKDSATEAYHVVFDSEGVNSDYVNRGYGFSVRLVTDASAAPTPTTTGTAKATIGGSEVDVKWIQFWENGPKFAEYNVGVTDGKAESYGGYYNWGMSDVHTSLNSDNYKSGESPLTGDDDTATKLWGGNWRMPTKAELEALLSNCDVVWTTVGGVNGRKFTGKGAYASNSVFLPAAGGCFYGEVSFSSDNGCCWSSTPYGGDANYLDFYSNLQYMAVNNRNGGFSVRAVLAEQD